MIYIDGNYQKRTISNKSVTIGNMQEGSYELLIIKDGYQDYNSTARIYPDRISRINVQIQWDYQEQEDGSDGSIAVYCNENNARIFINGVYTEMTSANQAKILDELKEGMYEITVIKDGYRIWQEKAIVYPGDTTSIFADLIKVENI